MNLKTSKGFTIVELLIVIVVIAILAAISIVAYTGIQNRARNSAALELANQVATKVRAYNAISGSWPTGISAQGTAAKTFTPAVADSDEAILGTINVTTITAAPTGTYGAEYGNGTQVAVIWGTATNSPTIYYRTSATTSETMKP